MVTQNVIAQLFRISYFTLVKRLQEFRQTPSAQLTLEQFHAFDSDIPFDPPSYQRNKLEESRDANKRITFELPKTGGNDDDKNECSSSFLKSQIGDIEITVPLPPDPNDPQAAKKLSAKRRDKVQEQGINTSHENIVLKHQAIEYHCSTSLWGSGMRYNDVYFSLFYVVHLWLKDSLMLVCTIE